MNLLRTSAVQCEQLKYECPCVTICSTSALATLSAWNCIMRTLWKKLLTFVLAVAEYLKVVVVDPDSSFCQLVDLAYDVHGIFLPVGFRFSDPKCNFPESFTSGFHVITKSPTKLRCRLIFRVQEADFLDCSKWANDCVSKTLIIHRRLYRWLN